jgi:hypothetical protein
MKKCDKINIKKKYYHEKKKIQKISNNQIITKKLSYINNINKI